MQAPNEPCLLSSCNLKPPTVCFACSVCASTRTLAATTGAGSHDGRWNKNVGNLVRARHAQHLTVSDTILAFYTGKMKKRNGDNDETRTRAEINPSRPERDPLTARARCHYDERESVYEFMTTGIMVRTRSCSTNIAKQQRWLACGSSGSSGDSTVGYYSR